MLTIGLCGGSGSGKGYVCNLFQNLDIPSIDCDEVYHSLISSDSEVMSELVLEFGEDIRSDNGGLDRKKLGSIVFTKGNESKLARLNEITHRYVLKVCREKIDYYRSLGKKAVLIDAPVLFESGFDKECDYTIAVIALKEIRIARICLRDSISAEQAEKRISSQIPNEILTQKVDFTIHNDGNESILLSEIDFIYNKICNQDF